MNIAFNNIDNIPSLDTSGINLDFLKTLNPFVIVIGVIIFAAMLVSVFSFSNNYSNTFTSIIEPILIVIFVVFVIINLTYYFKKDLNIDSNLSDLFNKSVNININMDDEKKVDDKIDIPIKPLKKKEVFHIPGNKYTYNDAEHICKGYNADLATYDQIESAYENGGEWCSYGWSDEQMAFFPTQKNTWNKLQLKKRKNACGRPGINGGYMKNKNIRFGVNCFGFKPKKTKQDAELMKELSYYPKTEEELLMEKKLAYWKNKKKDLLIAPFNKNAWNMV